MRNLSEVLEDFIFICQRVLFIHVMIELRADSRTGEDVRIEC